MSVQDNNEAMWEAIFDLINIFSEIDIEEETE